MNRLIICTLVLTMFNSCDKIAREVLVPNRCKTCNIIDENTGDTLSYYEGCGADFVDVEDDATIAAYHFIKSTYNCNISVNCKTWKKEDDE